MPFPRLFELPLAEPGPARSRRIPSRLVRWKGGTWASSSGLERKVEGAVSSAFARAFKGDVQPVEITARLQRELDSEAKLMSRDKRLVPNELRGPAVPARPRQARPVRQDAHR